MDRPYIQCRLQPDPGGEELRGLDGMMTECLLQKCGEDLFVRFIARVI